MSSSLDFNLFESKYATKIGLYIYTGFVSNNVYIYIYIQAIMYQRSQKVRNSYPGRKKLTFFKILEYLRVFPGILIPPGNSRPGFFSPGNSCPSLFSPGNSRPCRVVT